MSCNKDYHHGIHDGIYDDYYRAFDDYYRGFDDYYKPGMSISIAAPC